MEALVARLRGSEQVLARRMAADERAEIRSMPADIRQVEFPFTARRYYTLALTAIAEDRELTDEELDGVRARGAQRAFEGFPLHLFVHNWTRGIGILWQSAVASAGPEEQQGLARLASALFGLADQTISAGTEAYAEARAAIEAEERGETKLLARLLLAGQDPSAVADQAGIELAEAYDVMVVQLPSTPDEGAGEVAARGVAGRRKVLRILSELQRRGPRGLLPALEPGGGHVLIPRPPGGGVDIDEPVCREVFTSIESCAGGGVSAMVWPAPDRAAVPQVAREAAEWLRVARRAGHGAGLHRRDEAALEVQLSRPGVAREELLVVLARLESHRGLVPTVEQLLRFDGDRGRTARALGVHPNTVNNRLTKCRELLGFDPTSTRGVLVLSAALMARRVGDPQT